MIDTTERFLREIADRVDAGSVEEVRLFPPIRQGGLETGAAIVAVNVPSQERRTVYSARYCHTLKGKERGKWEVDVTAEADAPLLTVDAVVRGVMKRAGEPFEPERIAGAAFRTLVSWEPRVADNSVEAVNGNIEIQRCEVTEATDAELG